MDKQVIWILDDNDMMADFLGIFLSSRYEVKTFLAPKNAAMEMSFGHRPDLLISDLEMPDWHGLEFIRFAKKMSPGLPVIALSGIKESRYRIDALAAGADDFLAKPFHPAELSLRVGKLLKSKISSPEATQPAQPYRWKIFNRKAQLAGV